MTPDTYIDMLLEKYRKAPNFPFKDWKKNPISFYALINFWDDLFAVAAGKQKENYKALGDVKQDADSYIYRVINNKAVKKISVTPQKDDEVGGMFYLITNTGENPDGSDDQYDLGFVGDLDRTRLIYNFHMIRHYVSNSINSDEDRKKMDELFKDNYGKYFGFNDYNPFKSPLFPIEDIDYGDDE